MSKIRQIREAYSIQPGYWEVNDYDTYYDNPNACKEIILETIENVNYYVGYNYEDEIIFKFLADSVNVIYEP